MTDATEKKEPLALVISFIRPVGDGGQIHLQTTVPQDISLSGMNELLDLLQHSGRRMSVHSALERIESEFEANELSEAGAMVEIAQIDERNKGKAKMLTTDETQKTQAEMRVNTADVIRRKLITRRAILNAELDD